MSTIPHAFEVVDVKLGGAGSRVDLRRFCIAACLAVVGFKPESGSRRDDQCSVVVASSQCLISAHAMGRPS